MTALSITILIIGSILFFVIGCFVGVVIMALLNMAKEADRHIGADEEKKE